MGALGPDERLERRVRNWLLLLLRFAITRESADRWTVLTAADELDAAGTKKPAAPSYFRRTTKEVCEAVLAPGDQHSRDVLRRHAERIDDARLRRAFEAAVDIR